MSEEHLLHESVATSRTSAPESDESKINFVTKFVEIVFVPYYTNI